MLKTFSKGGIHPPENKFSADKKVERLPMPKKVSVPISQHIGAPSKVLVKKGDLVKTGQLIAEQSGFVSANIHSPVSGKIFKIDTVIDSSGYKRKAIIINVEGDYWDENIDKSEDLKKDFDLTSDEIIKKIQQAGIVGMGGATFPSHIKLMPPKDMKAEILIINGVECEPYLTSDHRLMLEKGEEMLVGIKILMKALKVETAIIGIENNKQDAIIKLNKLIKSYKGINIVPLKVQYPQGGEKQLIKSVTGREVPSGALPVAVGAVVHNVGTAFAVYEAVQKNKPLFERIVTITGKSLKKPGNFLVRIGTSISDLIDFAGGLPEDTGKIVGGGPMMGKALNTTDVPVTKGTSGILILLTKESQRRQTKACIRCAKCIEVCPMGLEPFLLMTLAEKALIEKSEKEDVMDCIECGSCSYTCPSDRPLLDYIRLGKTQVGTMRRAKTAR